jgi:hypothetical protein
VNPVTAQERVGGRALGRCGNPPPHEMIDGGIEQKETRCMA